MNILLLWLAFGALGAVVFFLGWGAWNLTRGYEIERTRTLDFAEQCSLLELCARAWVFLVLTGLGPMSMVVACVINWKTANDLVRGDAEEL